jgi:hypothetical protein
MPTASYLQLGNLYFVAVLRHQLPFAVLMRRAFHELARLKSWTDEDLIAVALPSSVGRETEKLLREWHGEYLPVSLLFASWGMDQPNEVFAISPSDATTEALRLALEHRLPIAYIDCEIAPKHLLLRRCASDPRWPDPAFVLEHSIGCTGYIEMIRQLCSEPPVRYEPVDTWREQHLAARLRELKSSYRRILVVCEAQNYLTLPTLLNNSGASTKDLAQYPTPEAVYRAGDPTIETLLHYLDEFPRLTEAFQRSRTDQGTSFHPFRELLRLVAKLSYGAEGDKPSARRVDAFVRYLSAMTRVSHRVMPRTAELYDVCRGCLGESIASKVLYHLGEYKGQITLERIRVKKSKRTASYLIEPRQGAQGIVARACSSGTSGYAPEPPIEPPSPPPDLTGQKSTAVFRPIWEKLRMKAIFLAESRIRVRHSREFRGSIDGGVDVRRTMRASTDASRSVYVKAHLRSNSDSRYRFEPIVWIVNAEESASQLSLKCVCSELQNIRVPLLSRAVGYDRKKVFTSEDGAFSLSTEKISGFLDLHGLWNSPLPKGEMRRLLQHWRHERHFVSYTARGCVVRALAGDASHTEWSTILMQTAVLACRQTAIVVLPVNMRIPRVVQSLAAERGKYVVSLDLASFSLEERNKLTVAVSVDHSNDADKVRTRVFTAIEKLGLE